MPIRKMLISMFMAIFFMCFVASCASTSNNSSSPNFSVGESSEIGFVKDWSNPEFKGGKTTGITADGYAVIDNRGFVEARNRAIEDAKRNAVEMAVGSMISGQKVAENNVIINNTIYSKTTGYISSYKVVDEEQTSGGYRVKIKAEVGVDMIEDNLMAMGILTSDMNFPLVVVLVVDEYEKSSDDFNIALEKHMTAKGFKFVDSKILKKVLAKEKIKLDEISGAKSADIISKIALGTGAQVAIVGNAEAYFFKNIEGTALKSYRSNVKVRAVNISDARTIAQSINQTGGVGGSEKDAAAAALQKSAETVGTDISKQITTEWQKVVQEGYEYNLLIGGLENFNMQIEFENQLKKHIAGVKNVYNKGFASNTAKFMVKYVGSARNLAIDINNKAADMGFYVEVKTFDDKNITITAMPFVQ